MPRTLLLSTLLTAASILSVAGCSKDAKTDPKSAGGAASLEDLTTRVKALEETNAKNAEALQFLSEVYGQQKAQREQEEASEPAPDAIFAVDITGDQVDGPRTGALVTVIEAWDFA
jgi:hypothetical protein